MGDHCHHAIKSPAFGRVMVFGTIETDGAGASTSSGPGWSAAKSATGTYRITLDDTYDSLDAYLFVLGKSTAVSQDVQFKAEDVDGTTPYVDCIVSGVSTSDALVAEMLALGMAPHQAAPAALIVTADATDAATGQALADAIATYVAAHDDDATAHATIDAGTCDVAAAAATTLATQITLVTELITDWITHSDKVGTIHEGPDMYATALQPVLADLQTSRITDTARFLNPIAAESVTLAAAGQIQDGALALTGVEPDYPRHLRFVIVEGGAATTAGDATVVGVNAAGETVSEVISVISGGGGTTDTVNAYATLTSVTMAGVVGGDAATTLSIGVDTKLGMPVPSGALDFTVHKTVVDDADEAVAGVDATGMSVDPTTAANAAHDYDFHFSYLPAEAQDKANAATNALKEAINNSCRGPLSAFAVTSGTRAAADLISGQIGFFLQLKNTSVAD